MQSVVTPDGRTLAVAEGGDPSGVPMLVHNGTPGSKLLYAPHVRDAEERGLRLFSYDRPGYGGSTRRPGPPIAGCAADVSAICDAPRGDRPRGWGISGGGPPPPATPARLPHRVAAAAALAPVAPYDAEGLDFYDGMGEQNVEEFGAVLEGEEAHRRNLERDRQELLGVSPEELAAAWSTLLGPADRAVLTGALAAYLLDAMREGIGRSLDGWFDDDVAFTVPWGFDLAPIRVPVLHWQGEQDKFVPFGHGSWLSEHIPGAESHLSPDGGHLPLVE